MPGPITRARNPYFLRGDTANVRPSHVKLPISRVKNVGAARKPVPPLTGQSIQQPWNKMSPRNLFLTGLTLSSIITPASFSSINRRPQDIDRPQDNDNNEAKSTGLLIHDTFKADSQTTNNMRIPPASSEPAFRTKRHIVPNEGQPIQLPSGPDSVKIVPLFDASCKTYSPPLSFAKIFRQIGRSLKNPISEFASASQNIYYHISGKGLGCPSPEDKAEVLKITQPIDEIISRLLSLVPGSQSLAIVQYIVGPLMENAADEMEGLPETNEMMDIVAAVNGQARMEAAAMPTQIRNELLENHESNLPPIRDSKKGKYHIVDGKNKVNVAAWGKHGLFDISFNEGRRTFEARIPFDSLGNNAPEGKAIPVYYSNLLNRWHSGVNGDRPIYTVGDIGKIEEIAIPFYNYQIRVKENSHPRQYGSGEIITLEIPVSGSNTRTHVNAIEMNGQLCPIRETQLPNDRGTGYEVYDLKDPEAAGRRVKYRNKCWVFAHKTQSQTKISKELSTQLAKLSDPGGEYNLFYSHDVSQADEKGLFWVGANQYMRSRAVDEDGDRYYRYYRAEYNKNLDIYYIGPLTGHRIAAKFNPNVKKFVSVEKPGLKGGGKPVSILRGMQAHRDSNTGRTTHRADVNGYSYRFIFSLEYIAWMKATDDNRPMGNDLFLPDERGNLLRIDPRTRTVSNSDRQASLQEFGISLSTNPDSFPPLPAGEEEIPGILQSIWVGNREIPSAHIENLQKNAVLARQGDSPLETHIYLSNSDPQAFEKT